LYQYFMGPTFFVSRRTKMRLLAFITTLPLSAGLAASAWAGHGHGHSHVVPEIGATGSLAAIVVVGALAAIIHERRRRS
jgi:hypothetical protein